MSVMLSVAVVASICGANNINLCWHSPPAVPYEGRKEQTGNRYCRAVHGREFSIRHVVFSSRIPTMLSCFSV